MSDAREKALQVVSDYLWQLHLEGTTPRCPVCRSAQLLPISVEVSKEYDAGAQDESMAETIRVVPMAVVICRKCSYVMHFAYRSILAHQAQVRLKELSEGNGD